MSFQAISLEERRRLYIERCLTVDEFDSDIDEILLEDLDEGVYYEFSRRTIA